MSNKHGTLTHHESWYTLSEWIERVRATMGDIDLDPTSNAKIKKVVKSTTFFDAESNGLAQKWFEKVSAVIL